MSLLFWHTVAVQHLFETLLKVQVWLINTSTSQSQTILSYTVHRLFLYISNLTTVTILNMDLQVGSLFLLNSNNLFLRHLKLQDLTNNVSLSAECFITACA